MRNPDTDLNELNHHSFWLDPCREFLSAYFKTAVMPNVSMPMKPYSIAAWEGPVGPPAAML